MEKSEICTVADVMAVIAKVRDNKKAIWEERSHFAAELAELEKKEFIDENQTVEWNREEKTKQLKVLRGKITRAENMYTSADGEIENVICNYLMAEYSLGREIAKCVYEKAYEDGHAAGYEECLYRAQEYGEFVHHILELANR